MTTAPRIVLLRASRSGAARVPVVAIGCLTSRGGAGRHGDGVTDTAVRGRELARGRRHLLVDDLAVVPFGIRHEELAQLAVAGILLGALSIGHVGSPALEQHAEEQL